MRFSIKYYCNVITEKFLFMYRGEIMAYVSGQNFINTFHLQKALQVGTIFPELCMPFCGKRGVCR